MNPIDTHCARCLAPTPPMDDPEFLEWEGVTGDENEPGDLIVCPDCMTPDERQAMDDVDIELTEFVEVVSDLDEQFDDETGTFQED